MGFLDLTLICRFRVLLGTWFVTTWNWNSLKYNNKIRKVCTKQNFMLIHNFDVPLHSLEFRLLEFFYLNFKVTSWKMGPDFPNVLDTGPDKTWDPVQLLLKTAIFKN